MQCAGRGAGRGEKKGRKEGGKERKDGGIEEGEGYRKVDGERGRQGDAVLRASSCKHWRP